MPVARDCTPELPDNVCLRIKQTPFCKYNGTSKFPRRGKLTWNFLGTQWFYHFANEFRGFSFDLAPNSYPVLSSL